MLRNTTASGVSTIERRASRIGDPVERLRYLREATRPPVRAASRPSWKRLAPLGLAFVVISLGSVANLSVPLKGVPRLAAAAKKTVSAPPAAEVWQVDQNSQFELYSNGLRIERRFEVAHEPRLYPLIARDSSRSTGALRSQPAGIVFHTTESDQAPFEPGQNRQLNRIGQELLLYVRQKRAYHYVIDRFGRVFRVVAESDTANHAGHSVWADDNWLYLDLNASFLGVAFEARTHTDEQPINQAQLHAARTLVDMLRGKYNLPPRNCVTHAQVSVNPDSMRIGWHTDWGTGFPYKELDLPDNYEYPNPAIALFGFEYDDTYRNSTSPPLWQGLARAEDQLRESAVRRGVGIGEYRRILRNKYRETISSLRQRSVLQEN